MYDTDGGSAGRHHASSVAHDETPGDSAEAGDADLPPHSGSRPDAESSPQAMVAQARAASDLVAVQRLVARLAEVPGVRFATLGAVSPQAHDPLTSWFADHVSVESPAELAYPVGQPEWGLELRVGFTDPGMYARLGSAVTELAAAADRGLRRPCRIVPDPARPGDRTGSGDRIGPRDRDGRGDRVAEGLGSLHAEIDRHAPYLIVAVDPTRGWYPVSDAFRAALGHRSGALPEVLLDLVHPDERGRAAASFLAACDPGRATDPLDLRVRTASGGYRTFEVVIRTLPDPTSGATVVYFAQDVTDRRVTEWAIRREQGRFEQLVATLPDGVLLLDTDGDLVVANDASRRMLHLDRRYQSLVGTSSQLLEGLRTCLVDGARAAERLEVMFLGNRVVTGQELAFLDGRVLELDFVPLRCDGVPSGALLHVRDVTSAAPPAVDHGAHDPEFLATLAHELRGPLSSVVAFSCLLAEDGDRLLDDDQRAHLAAIERNAHRLLRLIEDLLLLTRAESGSLRLEKAAVCPHDLVADVVAQRAAAAAEVGVELQGDPVNGPNLYADWNRLHQVVSNLVDNALRFTPRGGRVTVRAHPGPDGWTFEVADSGIGIPAVDLSRLFTLFFRGSNATAAVGRTALPGLGLGLVVCRAIVELHGGGIQVASTEGIGTTVTLTLPTGPERTSEVERESASRR